MHVLVTGGTGFVGSHAVAALAGRGHRVRVLSRSPDRLAEVLHPHGVTAEAVVGDMTDPVAVRTAVAGCEAVVHAAGEIGVDGTSGAEVDSNVVGTRNVVTAALEAGARRVVYTSSVTIHLPTTEAMLGPASPLAEPSSAYGASKREAEQIVLDLQAQGAPVTSLVLGGVYGPWSPNRKNSFQAVLGALSTMMLTPPGGCGVIDVRDVAAAVAAAVAQRGGPHRYMAGGHFLTWPEWVDRLGGAVGRPVVAEPISVPDMLALGRQFDEQRSRGTDLGPLSEEAASVMTSWVPTDDTATHAELGVRWRPVTETFSDVVAYLDAHGELPAGTTPS